MPKPRTRASIPIEKINALAELQRIGVEYAPKGDDEIATLCPVPAHKDTTPSCMVNIVKNVWKCHGASCNASGDIISYIAHKMGVDRPTVVAELSKRYDLGVIKSIDPSKIEAWHQAIWSAGPLLKALRDRGLTDDDIRAARLGYFDGRITIPIYDESGRVVNVRHYLPGAPSADKMKNHPGHGHPLRLYGANDQLGFGSIWICGGEMKARVVAGLLNPLGIGAVAPTAGEGAWEPHLNKSLVGKSLYLCYDVDAGGRIGARKVAEMVCYDASVTRIIRLPLDKAKYPKGDINDYVGACGAKATDLIRLMETAEEFHPEDLKDEDVGDGVVVQVKLIDAAVAENMGKVVAVEAVVQAMDTTPYIVPKTIGVSCSKDQPNCPWCPVRPVEADDATGRVTLRIKGTAAGILSMVEAPTSKQREAIREALRIPPCKTADFSIRDHYDVLDVRLSPQLQIGGNNNDHVMQPAFIVDADVELNSPFTFTGRVHPSPKSQQAILLMDKVGVAEDNLDQVKFGPDQYSVMTMFRPREWIQDSLQQRLDDVYDDLETNVTRIYRRRDLHLVLDMTYHSPLYLTFDGQIQKGWMNSIIIGDSSQGKSEASQRLMEHYGLGERVDCKNASVAGLLGGLNQIGNRWMVSWGVIPTHDRRLVVLEEVKGASTEILARLTDMRSSGVAEIPKIEKRRAHARTRLVFVSNPRSDRPISAYNFGIETIKELIGGLEDIRRFDLGLILSSADIDSKVINRMTVDRPTRQRTYSPELCRLLILWAWTRKPHQVRFERDAEVACMERAVEMCEKFSEALPLVDKGTMRYKLARVAAGLAARTFSTMDGDDSVLLVRKCHVEFVADWITTMYSSPTFGYSSFSDAMKFATSVVDPDQVRRYLVGLKHPRDFVEHILHSDEITMIDICDWAELDRDEGSKLLSFLVRKHALYRVKRWYVKTPEFITLLKSMKMEGIPASAVLIKVKKEEY